MQPKVFESGMDRLVEMFGEVSAKKTALYWDSLKDLPDGGFVLAVKEAIKRCEYFPRPKLLLDFAAPYRVPAAARPYNSRQVAECSVVQADEAKEAIARIAAGLDERFGDQPAMRLQVVSGRYDVGLSSAEFERRRKRLMEQAEFLARVAV